MNKSRPLALVCDDSTVQVLTIKKSLQDHFDCRMAKNADEALVILKKNPIEVLILDIQMRTGEEGLDYLPQIRQENPDLGIIVSSSRSDFTAVRTALLKGADDYLPKNIESEEYLHAVNRVLKLKRVTRVNRQKDREIRRAEKKHVLIGKSPAIEKLKRKIEKIRKTDVNVVIYGETGTGKEVVARQLRKNLDNGELENFVAVDSSTIQKSTAESILFGHEKGAFTGADQLKRGLFEEADGGVIYFDEIANMPGDIQTKLLRVLQEKEVVRMGASKAIPLEFRTVCATNQDLERLSDSGEFKFDLLQRLSVVPLYIPPLRERREDIPLLLEFYLEKHKNAEGQVLEFTEEAMKVLVNYSWKGNVRELVNLVAYVVTMAEGLQIGVEDLPEKMRGVVAKPFDTSAERVPVQATPVLSSNEQNYYKSLKQFEKEFLGQAYKQVNGRISEMAKNIGLDRSYLYTKLKAYGIYKSKRERMSL